jgi:phosphinothricin acetyltransferase
MTVRSAAVRVATEADLPAILTIHNAAMADVTSVWDIDPADIYDRIECQRAGERDGWPVLVAGTEDRIDGYGGYGPWRTQAGYARTVESSLFVAEQRRGHGVGGALLRALIAHARKASVHTMITGVESGNAVALALHEKHGFAAAARLPEVARKSDRWLDVTLMHLTLREKLSDRIVRHTAHI